ncbi:hypothetical protein EX895_000017 [Sporisorium graminicola]|uniref:Zn(2)-C6 fungal-type domain-containing protein n=1 Tax=Sporisorium graminicola TaxID=280036 RepID=A0A4V6EUB6_9BASI|nr:hypothetical protein EX895_000017 [Sporisorium graminicola]TKY90019.1 hypothetical protein EX895_000017 [Sporisorium graminicola]
MPPSRDCDLTSLTLLGPAVARAQAPWARLPGARSASAPAPRCLQPLAPRSAAPDQRSAAIDSPASSPLPTPTTSTNNSRIKDERVVGQHGNKTVQAEADGFAAQPFSIYIDLCRSDDDEAGPSRQEREKRQLAETPRRKIVDWLSTTDAATQDSSLDDARPPSVNCKMTIPWPPSPTGSAFSHYLDELLGPNFIRKRLERAPTGFTAAPSRRRTATYGTSSRPNKVLGRLDYIKWSPISRNPCDRCKERKLRCINTSITGRMVCDFCHSRHSACLRNGIRHSDKPAIDS